MTMTLLANTLFIDPGLHTGWALFHHSMKPIMFGQIQSQKVNHLFDAFDILIKKTKPKRCVIEDAEFWSGSLISRVSAKRGNLLKLAGIVYAYRYICYRNKVKSDVVSPREWKGQLPNTIVAKWVKEKIDMEFKSEHILCAVGIGLYKQGII